MLNHSCQLELSAMRTPFQINLNHVFVLLVLLDCEPTGEFHCPAAVMFARAYYRANSQFMFVAIYPHCYQTLYVYKTF